MLRIMSIDSGLGACGVIVGETDTFRHRLLDACLWSTSEKLDDSRLIGDTRVHRARELRELTCSQLRTWTPNVIVIEEFGFLQGAHATACLAMAVCTLVHEADRAHVPAIGCLARDWRETLAPLRGKRISADTKGLKSSAAKLARRQAQKANRERTIDREKRAHLEAQKRVENSNTIRARFNLTQQPHVLDALGQFVWATQHPLVRAMSAAFTGRTA